jgi:RNA polymerase sigma factor (sigma-70 family)
MKENPSKTITRVTLVAKLADIEDQKSWLRFFDRYYDLIKGCAMKVSPYFKEHDAEDVTQETIIAVARKIKGFEYDPKKGKFRGWLASIVRNKAKDLIRKNFRKKEVVFDEKNDLADARELIGDEEWEAHIIRNARNEVLTMVSPRDFQIFDAYVIRGSSKKDVCEKFSVSGSNLDQIKSRVGKKWRQAGEMARTGFQ